MAATSAAKPGIGGRGYRNTGTWGSPTWVAVNYIKDATPAMPWDMAEAGSRTTRAKQYAKTRADLSVAVVCRADDADAGYNAIADAAASGTATIDMMFLNAAITVEGCRGYRAEWVVNLTGEPQEADGHVYDNFEFKPGPGNTNLPSTVVMGASSTPTFTTL